MCSHLSIATWSESRSEHVGHGARRDNDERLRVFREAASTGEVWRESKIMSSAPGMCQYYPAYTSDAPEDVSTALHGSGEG